MTLNPVVPLWLKTEEAKSKLKDILVNSTWDPRPSWTVGMGLLNESLTESCDLTEHSVARSSLATASGTNPYSITGSTTCGIAVIDDPAHDRLRFAPRVEPDPLLQSRMPSSPLPGLSTITLSFKDTTLTNSVKSLEVPVLINGILITAVDGYTRENGGMMISAKNAIWTTDAWIGSGRAITVRGRATPGQEVTFHTITVTGRQITPIENASAMADKEGDWSWTIPADLAPAANSSLGLVAKVGNWYYAYTTIKNRVNIAPTIISTEARPSILSLP